MKTLIAYYSLSGNTERIVRMIQEATGADVERIETVKPYIGTPDDIVEQGQREVNAGIKPRIKPLSANLDDYDRVIIGAPTWWYTMAPAVLTFAMSNNWEGKTVVPFMTCGGWAGHVIDDMRNACEGAVFAHEKEIFFDSIELDRLITPEHEIESWIAELSS